MTLAALVEALWGRSCRDAGPVKVAAAVSCARILRLLRRLPNYAQIYYAVTRPMRFIVAILLIMFMILYVYAGLGRLLYAHYDLPEPRGHYLGFQSPALEGSTTGEASSLSQSQQLPLAPATRSGAVLRLMRVCRRRATSMAC